MSAAVPSEITDTIAPPASTDEPQPFFSGAVVPVGSAVVGVGAAVGSSVGAAVGSVVGAAVGSTVGSVVVASVASSSVFIIRVKLVFSPYDVVIYILA